MKTKASTNIYFFQQPCENSIKVVIQYFCHVLGRQQNVEEWRGDVRSSQRGTGSPLVLLENIYL